MIIAGVMVLVALAWVVVPLLRRERSSGVRHDAANLSILRDQLSELDADLASGAITREHHDQAKRELEARVIEETAPSEQQKNAAPPAFAGAWTAAIAASA